jgi:hypothetical protein
MSMREQKFLGRVMRNSGYRLFHFDSNPRHSRRGEETPYSNTARAKAEEKRERRRQRRANVDFYGQHARYRCVD